ncbi:MAG: hypothetical protein E7662_03735 [Ruminococcaceae bacterium]|nr:hypothetical protein [Oscillospiraceae bacterium]
MPKKTKELIEPMIFDERPVLIDPMIFYDRDPSDPDAVELQEPMEYYADAPALKIPVQEEKAVTVDLNALCETPEEKAPPAEDSSVPAFNPYFCPVPQAAGQAPKEAQTAYSEDTLTEMIRHAYPMAQRVLQKIPFMVIKKNLYYYNGSYYEAVTDDDAASLIIHHFRRDMEKASSRFMEDILYFIHREPNIHLAGEEITQDLVSFRNGVLDLTSGKLFRHSPKYQTFYRIEADYVPSAASLPTVHFDRFLHQITGGDPVLTERLWQCIGYILVSDRRAKSIFLLQGVGNSGKSVLTDFLCELFAADSKISMIFQELSGKFSGSELEGKFLCVSNDMPSDPLSAKAAALLKQISGNDLVSSDAKYKNRRQFRGTTKLVMVSNHPILLTSSDPAFQDRVVTIPFRYAVPREHWDTMLSAKILEERNIIVARAVEAYYRLRAQQYIFAGSYAMNEVTATGDLGVVPADTPSLILQFLQGNFEEDENAGVFMEDAYHAFLNAGCSVRLSTFAGYFADYAGQLFKARKIRRRRASSENPQSYLQGIRKK